MGVIFKKGNAKIKDIVDIHIHDAQGVSLFGDQVLERKMIHEIN